MKTNEVMKDDAPVELSEKELAEVGGGRRVISLLSPIRPDTG